VIALAGVEGAAVPLVVAEVDGGACRDVGEGHHGPAVFVGIEGGEDEVASAEGGKGAVRDEGRSGGQQGEGFVHGGSKVGPMHCPAQR
jgi:hypothetical protein